MARHCGIDTTVAKLALFAISAVVHDADRRGDGAALDLHRAGDRVQRRLISFQVVIMALLGGAHRAVRARCSASMPLVLLFEFLSARFPELLRP